MANLCPARPWSPSRASPRQPETRKPVCLSSGRGGCGKYTSDLLPHLGACVDEMCFIHSMTAKSNTHGPAENQMSTGFVLDGFPSVGAWVTTRSGSENQDLPAFVAIPDPRGVPQIGARQLAVGVPAGLVPGHGVHADKPIPNLERPRNNQRGRRSSHARFPQACSTNGTWNTTPATASWPRAFRPTSWPPKCSSPPPRSAISRAKVPPTLAPMESPTPTDQVRLRPQLHPRPPAHRARRAIRSALQRLYAMGEGVGNWDGHKRILDQYSLHAPILDQPCAALLRDLKQRGLLDETLVAFVTEFGRMPTFQKGANGRDHNPKGFTVWLAGAGVKPGFSYGATDEFGHEAVENITTIYDLHATMLHLLGLNHERLSFYNNGIERRLTDVHGHVLRGVLA